MPETDQLFVRLASNGKRVCVIQSVDGSIISSFYVHECEGMGSRPRRFIFTGHSNGTIQMWDLTTALDPSFNAIQGALLSLRNDVTKFMSINHSSENVKLSEKNFLLYSTDLFDSIHVNNIIIQIIVCYKCIFFNNRFLWWTYARRALETVRSMRPQQQSLLDTLHQSLPFVDRSRT